VVALSKEQVCSRSFAGIVGSIPNGGVDICSLWVLCVVNQRSLRRTDHSCTAITPSVVCLSVISKPREGLGPIELSSREKNEPAERPDFCPGFS